MSQCQQWRRGGRPGCCRSWRTTAGESLNASSGGGVVDVRYDSFFACHRIKSQCQQWRRGGRHSGRTGHCCCGVSLNASSGGGVVDCARSISLTVASLSLNASSGGGVVDLLESVASSSPCMSQCQQWRRGGRPVTMSPQVGASWKSQCQQWRRGGRPHPLEDPENRPLTTPESTGDGASEVNRHFRARLTPTQSLQTSETKPLTAFLHMILCTSFG